MAAEKPRAVRGLWRPERTRQLWQLLRYLRHQASRLCSQQMQRGVHLRRLVIAAPASPAPALGSRGREPGMSCGAEPGIAEAIRAVVWACTAVSQRAASLMAAAAPGGSAGPGR